MEHLVYISVSEIRDLKVQTFSWIQPCRNETSTSISFLQKCLTPQIYPNDVVKITSLYIRHLLTCPFQKIWRCLNKFSRLQFFLKSLKSWHPLIGKFSGRWSYFTDLKSKGRVHHVTCWFIGLWGNHLITTNFHHHTIHFPNGFLVGGFNPFEKY